MERAEDMHNSPQGSDSSNRGREEKSTEDTARDMSDSHTTPVLMAQRQPEVGENPKADIGKDSNMRTPPPPATLKSDRARILDTIHDTIGSQQVSLNELGFAPSWIALKAFDEEYTSKWADAYVEVDDRYIPANANVITSHIVYKVKVDEDGSKSLKSKIVPHGNRDSEKDKIRKDSSTAQFDVIRILIAVARFIGMRLAMADIKGAYLHSGPIQREIYVRPPREWRGERGKLWKLKKLRYGIIKAGRQWAKTVEEWMLTKGGLERIQGLNQLYVRRNDLGKITLIVAKVTDAFICGDSIEESTAFICEMKKRFEVGKVIVNENSCLTDAKSNKTSKDQSPCR